MSASSDGTDWINRLNSVTQINDLDSALTRLFFLPIAAFFVQSANAVEAFSRILIDPAVAFASGVQSIVFSLLGGPDSTGISGVIEAGSSATAGDINVFGFFALPVSLVIVFGSGAIIALYLRRQSTADLIPFTFTDIPLLGVEEQADDD
jgi:hypothetical protein